VFFGLSKSPFAATANVFFIRSGTHLHAFC
jgi:hypothetical protein